MAAYFFDSSALAKLYHPEVGTPEVDKIFQTPGIQVRISRLTVVEIPSVFAIKVRTQFISREDARLLVRQFHEDIVAQKFLVTASRSLQQRNGCWSSTRSICGFVRSTLFKLRLRSG